jgi:hypothetical protein
MSRLDAQENQQTDDYATSTESATLLMPDILSDEPVHARFSPTTRYIDDWLDKQNVCASSSTRHRLLMV